MTIPLLPLPAPHDLVTARSIVPVSPAVRSWARTVMEAFFANDDGAPDPERVEAVLDDFVDFVGRSPLRARVIMTLSLFVLVWVAPLLVWRLPTLEALDLDKRAEALDRVEQGWLGPTVLVPKAILSIVWFEHPGTRAETHTEVTCLRA